MAGKSRYTERKREIRVTLTPTAIELLNEMGQALGISSVSEVIEQLARGTIPGNRDDRDQLRTGKPLAI